MIKLKKLLEISDSASSRMQYFVSTTRDKLFVSRRMKRGVTPGIESFDIAFQLNGDKLSEKYKAAPVRFNRGKSKAEDDVDFEWGDAIVNVGDEMETRFSGARLQKDKGIKPILPYIEKLIFTEEGVGYFSDASVDAKQFVYEAINDAYKSDSTLKRKYKAAAPIERFLIFSDLFRKEFNLSVELSPEAKRVLA